MSKIITVTITNWDHYNNAESRKPRSPWWLKLSNRIHMDQDFLDFDAEERWAWICILCEASLQKSNIVKILIEHHATVWRLKRDSIIYCIKKLKRLHIVTTNLNLAKDDLGALDKSRIEEKRGEEIRNNIYTYVQSSFVQQVERAYSLFPRKQGKTRGMGKLVREIKTNEDAELLLKAVSNFKTKMSQEGRPPDKIMLFSTFAGEWRDWVNPETDENLRDAGMNAVLDELFP